jgi:nucleotide-binding universal stress UspA family protein
MIEEILACLDGSDFAEAILPYAAGISRLLGADLSLLTIVEDSNEPTFARKYLKGLADRYGAPACRFSSIGPAGNLPFSQLPN